MAPSDENVKLQEPTQPLAVESIDVVVSFDSCRLNNTSGSFGFVLVHAFSPINKQMRRLAFES